MKTIVFLVINLISLYLFANSLLGFLNSGLFFGIWLKINTNFLILLGLLILSVFSGLYSFKKIRSKKLLKWLLMILWLISLIPIVALPLYGRLKIKPLLFNNKPFSQDLLQSLNHETLIQTITNLTQTQDGNAADDYVSAFEEYERLPKKINNLPTESFFQETGVPNTAKWAEVNDSIIKKLEQGNLKNNCSFAPKYEPDYVLMTAKELEQDIEAPKVSGSTIRLLVISLIEKAYLAEKANNSHEAQSLYELNLNFTNKLYEECRASSLELIVANRMDKLAAQNLERFWQNKDPQKQNLIKKYLSEIDQLERRRSQEMKFIMQSPYDIDDISLIAKKDEKKIFRFEAIQALAMIRNFIFKKETDEATKVLQELTKDPDSSISQMANEALNTDVLGIQEIIEKESPSKLELINFPNRISNTLRYFSVAKTFSFLTSSFL